MEQEPSFAISVRVDHRSLSRAKGARSHDLRKGRIPDYVDQERTSENSVILEPAPPSSLRKICEDRRKTRTTQRAMKRDAAVASCFIITFGTAAQPLFESLTRDAQDAAYRAVGEAIAKELGVNLTGLVAHRDETAPHAHGQMPAYHPDGTPLSKILTPTVGKRLQDAAAAAIAPFEPRIIRGKPKAERIADGEPRSKTVHRSVRELHHDLPAELDKKRTEIAVLEARIAKMQAKATLTEANARTLATYERRLAEKVAAIEETGRTILDAAQKAHQDHKARLALIEEREHAVAERERQSEIREDGFSAAVEAVRMGTITRDADGKPHLADPVQRARLLPVWRSLGPAIMGLIDLRAELASGVRRFRELFRRNEVRPDLQDEVRDIFGGDPI